MPRGPQGLVPLGPMSAQRFEAELRRLATTVVAPAPGGRYYFTAGDAHPTLDDPGRIASPSPGRIASPSLGLAAWLEEMLSDSPGWTSASDP